jgi:YVTN family beta-propeller protein
MSSRLCTFFGLALSVVVHGTAAAAPYAYITNAGSDTVSVIDIDRNVVAATIQVGLSPQGVAVNTTGSRVYVANVGSNTVSVIDGVTNSVIATIPVGIEPSGVAVNAAGTRVYVASDVNNNVTVIDAQNNTVIATVPVGPTPLGVVVNPAGTWVYVANADGASVSVIDAAANTVIATVPVATVPFFIAVNPAGTRVYVTHLPQDDPSSSTVSVIDTTSNARIASIPLGWNAGGGIAINASGTRVYVAALLGNVVAIDTSSNSIADVLPAEGNFAGISLNAAGTRVYVVDIVNNVVVAIDIASRTVIARIPVGLTPAALGQFIAPGTASEGVSTAVEYHHASFDHFFITPVPAEIALLDARTPPFQEWSRTGYSFSVYSPAAAPGQSVAICRFFNEHYAPKSSHFYAGHGFGCETTLAMFPDWQLEDDKLFNAMLPDATTGACATGTIPVYRLYNNGMGDAPNHRFVTSLAEQEKMINLGWTPEGSGSGVAMCVPQ